MMRLKDSNCGGLGSDSAGNCSCRCPLNQKQLRGQTRAPCRNVEMWRIDGLWLFTSHEILIVCLETKGFMPPCHSLSLSSLLSTWLLVSLTPAGVKRFDISALVNYKNTTYRFTEEWVEFLRNIEIGEVRSSRCVSPRQRRESCVPLLDCSCNAVIELF